MQNLKALLDKETYPDGRETLLMTVAVAGAATTSGKAQLLTLAVLCGKLADSDASIRAAAAELVESKFRLLVFQAMDHLFRCYTELGCVFVHPSVTAYTL